MDEDINPASVPINPSTAGKSEVLFYLAGCVPIAVSKFAKDCTQDESELRDTLNSRFQKEVKVDHTGFLTLTDAARNDVLSFTNPLISDAVAAQKRAKALAKDGEYRDAIEPYQSAEALFSEAEVRLTAVGDVPDKLTRRIENVRNTHDKIQKKVVNDVVTHRKFISEQHEKKGDNAMQNAAYTEAADEFELAVNAFEEAKDAVENYNSQLLSEDSTRLDVSTVEKRIQALERKGVRAKKNISEKGDLNSNKTKQNSNKSVATGSHSSNFEEDVSSSDPSPTNGQSREAMISTLQELHQGLENVPTTTELAERTEWSPNDYYQEFGGWDEALAAADIDKEAAMIRDIERVAERVSRVPNTTDMDEHGSYSGSSYSSYFDSWKTALERANLPDKVASSEKNRREEILETIRSLHESLGRLPKGTDFQGRHDFSQQDITSTFGSWDEALAEAGIDKEQLLIDELQRVSEELGEKPSTTDMNRIGDHSATMYNKYFGSWKDAIDAASLDDSSTQAETVGQTSNSDTRSENISRGTDDKFEQTSVGAGVSDEPGGSKEREITTEESNSSNKSPEPVDFTTISEMAPNKRYSGEVAVKLESESYPGAKKDAAFEVTDASGEKVRLNFWSKHNLETPESVGLWYIIEEIRMQQWEKDGETNRNLSSSRDTRWRKLDQAEATETQTSEDGKQEPDESTSSSVSETNSSGENDDESDGMLDSIVSEFEDDLV